MVRILRWSGIRFSGSCSIFFPAHPWPFARQPLPPRGDGKDSSIPRRVRARVLRTTTESFASRGNKGRGSGAPNGAQSWEPRSADPCCHGPMPRARQRALSGRARLPALHRGSRRDGHVPAQLQARLAGTGPNGRAVFFQPQCSGSTPRPGRNAGGHDARSRPGAVCKTARRRRLRSAFRIASRNAPSDEQDKPHVT